MCEQGNVAIRDCIANQDWEVKEMSGRFSHKNCCVSDTVLGTR